MSVVSLGGVTISYFTTITSGFYGWNTQKKDNSSGTIPQTDSCHLFRSCTMFIIMFPKLTTDSGCLSSCRASLKQLKSFFILLTSDNITRQPALSDTSTMLPKIWQIHNLPTMLKNLALPAFTALWQQSTFLRIFLRIKLNEILMPYIILERETSTVKILVNEICFGFWCVN